MEGQPKTNAIDHSRSNLSLISLSNEKEDGRLLTNVFKLSNRNLKNRPITQTIPFSISWMSISVN